LVITASGVMTSVEVPVAAGAAEATGADVAGATAGVATRVAFAVDREA